MPHMCATLSRGLEEVEMARAAKPRGDAVPPYAMCPVPSLEEGGSEMVNRPI